MKKRLLNIMLVLLLVISCAGCGNQEAEETSEVTQSTEETVNDNSDEAGVAEEEAEISGTDAEPLAEEKEKTELSLKEYEYSFEDRNVDTSGPYVIPFEDFKECGETFYLTDSVDLYIDNGTCVGYTKPDIQIIAIMEYDDWYYIGYGSESKFVKKEDIKANGFAGTKEEYLASVPKKDEVASADNTQSNASVTKPETTPAEVAVPETSVPVENVPAESDASSSDKYTPEEAVAVYRSLMEAGGITWNPDLKGITSWGTGWIYLDKGQPEWTASANLESFAMGDTVGNPSTEFYFEVTGSDEDAVYITQWHN